MHKVSYRHVSFVYRILLSFVCCSFSSYTVTKYNYSFKILNCKSEFVG